MTEEAIDITGYVAEEPTSQTITIQVEGNVINFYYTKRTDLSYTVNYLEKDTDVVLAEAKVVNGKTYQKDECIIYPYTKAICQVVMLEVPVFDIKEVK